MARPASVFVRALSPEEALKLRRISRQSKVFALRQRAQIVLASDARSTAVEIARVLQTDENQVRRVITEFNAGGMASLRPRIGGGRPKRIDDAAPGERIGKGLRLGIELARRAAQPEQDISRDEKPGREEKETVQDTQADQRLGGERHAPVRSRAMGALTVIGPPFGSGSGHFGRSGPERASFGIAATRNDPFLSITDVAFRCHLGTPQGTALRRAWGEWWASSGLSRPRVIFNPA